MDVVSTVRSLCTLAATILTWIEQTREKEEALSAVASTVARIHSILVPYQEEDNLEPSLANAFKGLGDMLKRTQEHLIAYGRQRRRRNSINGAIGFFIPAQITKLLVQDEQQLTHQLVIILFCLASISFFRDRHSIPSREADRFAIRSDEHEDILEFWRDYVGAKVLYVPTERFSEALNLCFGDQLNSTARSRLSLCLDEFRTGGVAMHSLERFVGQGTLKQAVEKFKSLGSRPPPPIPTQTSDGLPLLVWIDDNPSNNANEVEYARNKGIKVLELTSTALAKLWIEENEEFLRANDTAGSIRFISDTARFESDDQTDFDGASASDTTSDGVYLNITAGENIARYLRGHFCRAPLLIYCGAGIVHTRYVELYEATGSTRESGVVLEYIRALSDRVEDDKRWQHFSVV